MKLSAINRNLEGRIVPHNPAGKVSSPILDQIKHIRPLKIPIVRNLEVRFVPQNPVGKVCVKQGFESCMLYAKLYIPSTINIWKKVLTKSIWAEKNWLASDRVAFTSSKTEILNKIGV